MRAHRTNAFSIKKIRTLSGLKKELKTLKAKGKRIVFTNGCFDILHYGHVKYLEDAKAKGDILVVAVNSDSSIKRIKGPCRPVISEKDRLATIAALESVDYALLFNEDTPLKTIQAVEPDVLIKGSDWDIKRIVGADLVTGLGGRVETVKLIPGRSTSAIIKKN